MNPIYRSNQELQNLTFPELVEEVKKSTEYVDQQLNSGNYATNELFEEIPEWAVHHIKIHSCLKNRIVELEKSNDLIEISELVSEVFQQSKISKKIIKEIFDPEAFQKTIALTSIAETLASVNIEKALNIANQIPNVGAPLAAIAPYFAAGNVAAALAIANQILRGPAPGAAQE